MACKHVEERKKKKKRIHILAYMSQKEIIVKGDRKTQWGMKIGGKKREGRKENGTKGRHGRCKQLWTWTCPVWVDGHGVKDIHLEEQQQDQQGAVSK